MKMICQLRDNNTLLGSTTVNNTWAYGI